jgi:vacuolar-type H+-ATPase subunit E/Vma4
VLEGLIVEGVSALEGDEFRIEGGKREHELWTKAAISRVVKRIEEKTNRKVSLSVGKDVLSEGGVVVVSSDERMLFDNRFSARMERMEDAMRLEVMRRVFEA